MDSLSEPPPRTNPLSDDSIPQSVIDSVFRLGGCDDASRMRVTARFMAGNSTERIASFLQEEYRGGIGIQTDAGKYAAWFDESGLRIARGSWARNVDMRMTLPWNAVTERVGELLDAGQFATADELRDANKNFRTELSQKLWYLRRDFSEGVSLLPSLNAFSGGGFPSETERLSNVLAEPNFLASITQEMEDFNKVYAAQRNVLRFHYHKVPQMLDALHDLAAPWKEYSSDMLSIPAAAQFITEDEIDAVLTHGSNVVDGKARIYRFFTAPHSAKGQQDFLRDEYGYGGHSDALDNKQHSWVGSSAKGIYLSKPECRNVTLSWPTVSARIDKLIKNGRYLSAKEMEKLAQPDSESPEAGVDSPAFTEHLAQYSPIVRDAVLADAAYQNACRNSDRENAMTEGEAAIRRAVFSASMLGDKQDVQLYRLFFDNEAFRNGLTQSVLGETYAQLSTPKKEIRAYYVTGDPFDFSGQNSYKTFADIDAAIAAYDALPNHIEKELGIESTDEPTARLALLTCVNGLDEHTAGRFFEQDSTWETPQIQEAAAKAQSYLDTRDAEAAFQSGNRYLHILGSAGGVYSYSLYDTDFVILRLGEISKPNESYREAIDEICTELEIPLDARRAIDAAKLMQNVRTAERGPKSTAKSEPWIYAIYGDSTASILRYSGTETDVEIPGELDGHRIVGIGNRTFAQCKDLHRVVVPDSVERIEGGAFYANRELSTVVFGSGVKVIEAGAFNKCSALASVTLPPNLETIGVFAFCDCTALQNIAFPESLRLIAGNAFDGCSRLKAVTIPAQTEVSGLAFPRGTEITRREPKAATEKGPSAARGAEAAYMLLSRLQEDCKYYLGNGCRAEKYLWAGSVDAQIAKMQELFDSLTEKPEWLTQPEIDEYARRMRARYEVVTYDRANDTFENRQDCATIPEAEQAAIGYLLGAVGKTQYGGAAVYDWEARRYIRCMGDFPFAEAQEQAEAAVATAPDSLTFAIGFSEHPAFYAPDPETGNLVDRYNNLSFALGNYLLGVLDAKQNRERQNEAYGVGWYDKTDFQIHAIVSGEEFNYSGRFDIGDGEGDLLAHLRNFTRYELDPDNALIKAIEADNGKDAADAHAAAWERQRDILLPFLERNTALSPADHALFREILSHEAEWHPTVVTAQRAEALSSELCKRYETTAYAQDGAAESIAILRNPDGYFSNHFRYDKDKGYGETVIGPFARLEDAQNDVLARYTDAREVYDRAVEVESEKAIDAHEAATDADRTQAAAKPVDRAAVPQSDAAIQYSPASSPTQEQKPAERVRTQNFVNNNLLLGNGTLKEKYRANVAAIRLLKDLEARGAQATYPEQRTLSGYVGWGALADAFDESKPAWASEYRELKALLSESEYDSARASTLNAHFTSPEVIRPIWAAIRNMGFEGGKVLEPAMGVGNFFGMLPYELRDTTKLYGVELDSLSGRIAKQLYPRADITIAGFETTNRKNFYDLAIGNVPFGNYTVNDKEFNSLGFSIHNYFFAKALDQVRPGGVVAFITSRYTMDAKSPAARKYIAQRAELLGAIRLPNDAFSKNAGTDVVADIIFLQKRARPIEVSPDWVHLGKTQAGYEINSYFVDHPEMVLGTQAERNGRFGPEYTVDEPISRPGLSTRMDAAIANIHGRFREYVRSAPEEALSAPQSDAIEASPDVRNFSFAAVDGEVYFRENDWMNRVALKDAAKARILGLISMRQILRDLIDYQVNDRPDPEITDKQQELSTAYDAFTAKFGLVNSPANRNAFEGDSSYTLLCSLENLDDSGNLVSKADIFTKRTIRPRRVITSVDTPTEALAVSIGEKGKVDLAYMAQLLGTPGEYEHITAALQGIIFRDPTEANAQDYTAGWHTADDYLSGNVREKLKEAQWAAYDNPAYAVNEEALKAVQPEWLRPGEIHARLGAAWIDPEYVTQFMYDTFKTPARNRRDNGFWRISAAYSPANAEWQILGKKFVHGDDVAATVTYGTKDIDAYELLEKTLNGQDAKVFDHVSIGDGRTKPVVNREKTIVVQQKQDAIREAFQDWIWKDFKRSNALTQKYNHLFNATRVRQYDGSHINFVGMNTEIKLRDHQLSAVARILYGGNTLLAHEVGAGKTFEMVAAAMESKRLGLSHKPMFVVPNHLISQWGSEFLRLYPQANILVSTKSDFSPENRRKFVSRIATGDYDAVIIGHSQFLKIPMSIESQERHIREQIADLTTAIAEGGEEHFSVKALERAKRSLEKRLKKLLDAPIRDDVITFEELGVDRLFVDEAHSFKNLFVYTKMQNVAGVTTTEAQKSSDMFLKCRYLDGLTGGRGVVFATATPVSNSMTELFTMQRYLQYKTLRSLNVVHFDAWASTFGQTQTALELAPEGSGYRARTRFAKFVNVDELKALFGEVADVKTAAELNLPVPKAEFETLVAKPSGIQTKLIQSLSERAEKIHEGKVDPKDDNMLCITSDGKKIGLDQRLIDPELPDNPESKVNLCVENVFHIWQDGTPKKLTQLIFCDMSTPKSDGSFNVYDDIRNKLVARGVPREQVVFIHEADTEAKKEALFRKVRSGDVRVLIGSTQKMGTGMNVQDKMIACHHLDAPWRPADMTQREGRIIRQGNTNDTVKVYRYVTESTFDAQLYQTLECKQQFISQFFSPTTMRECGDVDATVLSYAEVKALCAGNPLIREKMELDLEVNKLKAVKSAFTRSLYDMSQRVEMELPMGIRARQEEIAGLKLDIARVEANPLPDNGVNITIDDFTFTDAREAEKALFSTFERCNSSTNDAIRIGSYRGFDLSVFYDGSSRKFAASLRGAATTLVQLGNTPYGNLDRLNNALTGLPGRLNAAEERLARNKQELTDAKAELQKPFPQEAELKEKTARLAELNAALNLDQQDKVVLSDEQPDRDATSPGEGKHKNGEDLDL